MKVKSILIFIICFVISGEILIRITDHFKILESNRFEKMEIAIDSSSSKEFILLQNNQIDLSDSSLRVLVLGDSYMVGGFSGTFPPDKKISNQLRKLLQKDTKYKNTYVLDVSQANANNLDNTNAYFRFLTKYNPQVIVLGYNYNDINGNLEEKVDIPDSDVDGINSGSVSKMKIRQLTEFLYKSAILNYTMPKFNKWMLSLGIIIPKSRLDNNIKYYQTNHYSWQKSQEHLTKMITDINQHHSKLIVYHFAVTNLIEYPELFEKTNHVIESYFKSFSNVEYISGTEQFRGKKASDYYIYKFDGHPNPAAHTLVANQIYESIRETIKNDPVEN